MNAHRTPNTSSTPATRLDAALADTPAHRLGALGLAAVVTLGLLAGVHGMAAQDNGALAWAHAAQLATRQATRQATKQAARQAAQQPAQQAAVAPAARPSKA